MRRVLKNIGSLYLHRDPTARHYLKLWLDAIGGKQSLRNDCLWTYGLGGSAPRVYSKSDDYYFNKPEAERETERRGGRMARNSVLERYVARTNRLSDECLWFWRSG